MERDWSAGLPNGGRGAEPEKLCLHGEREQALLVDPALASQHHEPGMRREPVEQVIGVPDTGGAESFSVPGTHMGEGIEPHPAAPSGVISVESKRSAVDLEQSFWPDYHPFGQILKRRVRPGESNRRTKLSGPDKMADGRFRDPCTELHRIPSSFLPNGRPLETP